MVNHFSSLLGNLNIADIKEAVETYLLADNFDFDISTSNGYAIAVALYPYVEAAQKNYTPLVNRHIGQIELPQPLQRFYDLIFPAGSSDYYRQFLLYSYLRIVDASDKSANIKKYDTRISYDLDKISEYFRFPRVSITSSNVPGYKLLVSGNLTNKEDVQYFTTNFVITQIENTSSVLVYSPTQGKFHKQGKPPASNSVGMEVLLELADNNNTVTKAVNIGETGLKFNLAGPFTADTPQGFLNSGNRVWEFSAEAPFYFDFKAKLEELNANYQIVENMLAFGDNLCDPMYTRMWHLHYNDVYRFAALLLAYVERVDLVWQKRLI
jgi:hypothetical protein